jgi:hypothetical protein
MDVFVIPIFRDRYELYCEPAHDADAASPEEPAGFVERWRRRLTGMIKAAEQHESQPESADAPSGWLGRLQGRMMAWAAERIAEQRLLWRLRGQTDAVAVYPDDLTQDQAMTLVSRTLQRDYERHRRWMIVDGVAFLLTSVLLGPLFLLVPGVANLPAVYFGFRFFGHWFSMRGARQALRRVTWSGRAEGLLTELRTLETLDPAAREQRVRALAAQLGLPHLARFLERMALRHA